MRLFIAVLILIFSLQSWTKADDIRDFEIEGMSIGDSLLDYISENKIKKLMKTDYPNSKKFSRVTIVLPNMTTYEDSMIHFKTNDKKYIIYSIDGGLFFKNNYKGCKKKKDEITEVISAQFPNLEKTIYSGKHSHDNESLYELVKFKFQNSDEIRIWCRDWTDKVTKEKNWHDNLAVTLSTAEFRKWVNNEAFD